MLPCPVLGGSGVGRRPGCDGVHLVQGNQWPLSNWGWCAPGIVSPVAVDPPLGRLFELQVGSDLEGLALKSLQR